MREKLLDLMKNEGLKPSQLAEMLEINPAGISHILAGRNKPGFDLLQKILRRFPQIDPDWLLLDSPIMYRDNAGIPRNRAAEKVTGPATASPDNNLFATHPGLQPSAKEKAQPLHSTEVQETSGPAPRFSEEIHTPGKAAVKQVVVFYEDKTFESFTPKRN